MNSLLIGFLVWNLAFDHLCFMGMVLWLCLILNLQSSGRGKRGRCNKKQDEKQKEVIHVRARRGQATDGHSLAERVIMLYSNMNLS